MRKPMIKPLLYIGKLFTRYIAQSDCKKLNMIFYKKKYWYGILFVYNNYN